MTERPLPRLTAEHEARIRWQVEALTEAGLAEENDACALLAEIDALRVELTGASEVAYDATIAALAVHAASPHGEGLPHKWDKIAACAVAGAVRAIAPRS